VIEQEQGPIRLRTREMQILVIEHDVRYRREEEARRDARTSRI